MQAQPRSTLSGKARRVHYRNRAVRLSGQQQIAEAFDAEFEPTIPRLKPQIRTRSISEFLPSADPAGDLAGADTQTQFELPFARPADQDSRPPSGLSRIGGRFEEPVGAAPVTMATNFRKSGRNDLAAAGKLAAADKTNEFTLGGLLYGSLIGSATAALILVCLRALFP